MTDGNKIKLENEILDEKFMDSVKKYVGLFIEISGAAVVIYRIITHYFNFKYALEASDFYRVPKKYFFENMLDDNFVVLFFGIVLFLLIFSPYIIKKISHKKKLGLLESVGHSLIIVLVTFVISLLYLIEILINKFGVYIYINYIIIGILILNSITFLLCVYILNTDFSDKSRKNNCFSLRKYLKNIKNKYKYNNKKKRIKKQKFKKKDIFVFLFIFALALYSYFIFSLVSTRINSLPADKHYYEVIKIKNAENFSDNEEYERAVILSEVNGNFLIMYIDNNEYINDNLKLKKGFYKLVSPINYEIEVKYFKDIVE